jgi:hypothetical protein
MKTAAKTTINSIEEMLHEINFLADEKDKEDYAKIFMVKSNLSTTYQSNHYLEIMDITTTIGTRNIYWNADVTF